MIVFVYVIICLLNDRSIYADIIVYFWYVVGVGHRPILCILVTDF